MLENPRRGRQARNKKCSENSRSQIVFRTDIFRKLTLGAPDHRKRNNMSNKWTSKCREYGNMTPEFISQRRFSVSFEIATTAPEHVATSYMSTQACALIFLARDLLHLCCWKDSERNVETSKWKLFWFSEKGSY